MSAWSVVKEWLWLGRAVGAAQAAQAARSNAPLARKRARVSAEVGERTLNPSGPWLSGDASHLAAGLFAESIGWSLRAAAAAQAAATEAPSHVETLAPARAELEALIASHRELLLQAAGDESALDRVVKHLLERDFEDLPSVPSDVERMARELSRVASQLLARVDPTQQALDLVLFQRGLRMGGVLLVLVAALYGLSRLVGSLEARADLAVGKPWTTSSTYETVCASPRHQCGQDKGYFEHTQEDDSPWLEIDLTRKETFSGVRVLNRQDCCAERAVPLVVEVSTNHKKWREIARREEPFDDWKASFDPVTARWVRFRVARRSLLHLGDVRVLR